MKKKILIFASAIIMIASGTVYALSSKSIAACLCGSTNYVCTTAYCIPDSKCCEMKTCTEDCCNDNCCEADCCK